MIVARRRGTGWPSRRDLSHDHRGIQVERAASLAVPRHSASRWQLLDSLILCAAQRLATLTGIPCHGARPARARPFLGKRNRQKCIAPLLYRLMRYWCRKPDRAIPGGDRNRDRRFASKTRFEGRFFYSMYTHRTRTVFRAKPLGAPARCAEPPRPGWRQRPKRKRWERTSATDASDQADIAQRPAKRSYRANPEEPPEALWDRWRRMEPRRKRRT